MLDQHRNTLLLGIVLAVYTVLLVMPAYLSRSSPVGSGEGTIIGPATGIVVLFCIVLFLLVSIFSSLRDKIKHLQDALTERDTELADIRINLEQTIEKRTFEIAIVNASLNREIAERIQAEAQSKALQKQMELILNSAGEGIFGLDTNGTVIFANTAAALMLGWQREELTGQNHHELVHHSHADGRPHSPDDCLIRQAYCDGIVHFSSDDVFWTKEGNRFPVEYVSTPIIDNSVIRGAVVVFRDLSTFS